MTPGLFPALRPLFLRTLLLVAIAISAFSVFASSRRVEQLHEALAATDHETVWLVYALEFELQRLLVAGERYLRQPDAKLQEELALRLDILLSRLPLLAEGREGQALRQTPGVAELTGSLAALLRQFDPALRAPQPAAAEVRRFLEGLMGFVGPVRQVVLTVMAQSAERQVLLRHRLDRYVWVHRLSMAGLTAALAILLTLLWREGLRTQRLLAVSRRQEQDERYRAQHDPLTGLANRRLFERTLVEAAAAARRGEERFALLFLDLDRFKEVNDLCGHPTGDRLLQAVAGRLRGQVRQGDLVGRLGGDEFSVIQRQVDKTAMVAALAERLAASVTQAYEIDERVLHIGVSIGVAIAPDQGSDPAVLARLADRALYRAKAAGGGVVLASDSDAMADSSRPTPAR
jgi:diguanylate cyclase (GGDEF)-like protein